MLRATANKKNVYSLLGVLIRIDWFLFKEKCIISLRNILFYTQMHFYVISAALLQTDSKKIQLHSDWKKYLNQYLNFEKFMSLSQRLIRKKFKLIFIV